MYSASAATAAKQVLPRAVSTDERPPEGTPSGAAAAAVSRRHGHDNCGCVRGAACCLSCPLDECVWGATGPLKGRQETVRARDNELIAAWMSGLHPPELSQRYGISRRTVLRILQAVRRGEEAAA